MSFDPAGFVRVDVDEGPATGDGLSLRFKVVEGPREVATVPYESEAGVGGDWRVEATDDVDGVVRRGALAARVDDSSDGVAWLVYGGRQGLVLTHAESRAVERVPYLLLASDAALG